jgi:hypothetical protein
VGEDVTVEGAAGETRLRARVGMGRLETAHDLLAHLLDAL